MTTSTRRLPQLDGGWFLTDGGIETVLIYQEGVDLPEFAAFVLLQTADGRDTLRRYYRRYLDIAVAAPGAGFILEEPYLACGHRLGAKLGFDADAMQRINTEAVALMNELRTEYVSRIAAPIVISGCIGPRGDGYVAGAPMEPEDARGAHQLQADALAAAGVDQITAITMTSSAEAMGVARAAARAGRASAISFTVETDGKLPSGEPLGAAIQAVDADAEASGHDAPAYYMINCAHPRTSNRSCQAQDLARAHTRPARKCFNAQSRRTRRNDRTRQRQPAGPCRPLPASAHAAVPLECVGRLLRD